MRGIGKSAFFINIPLYLKFLDLGRQFSNNRKNMFAWNLHFRNNVNRFKELITSFT